MAELHNRFSGLTAIQDEQFVAQFKVQTNEDLCQLYNVKGPGADDKDDVIIKPIEGVAYTVGNNTGLDLALTGYKGHKYVNMNSKDHYAVYGFDQEDPYIAFQRHSFKNYDNGDNFDSVHKFENSKYDHTT